MLDLGRRLKEAREVAGLTQAEAGKLGGVGRDAVRGYEEGNRTIPADYVAALALEVGWSAHWLLTGTGPRQPEGEDSARAKIEAIRQIIEGGAGAADASSPDAERLVAGDAARTLSQRAAVNRTAPERPVTKKKRRKAQG